MTTQPEAPEPGAQPAQPSQSARVPATACGSS